MHWNVCFGCQFIFKLLRRQQVKKTNFHFSYIGREYNNNSNVNSTLQRSSDFSISSRHFCEKTDVNNNTYFITTPIFYVNAAPHIGHLHTAVLADAVQRWRGLTGSHCIFSTGTDEHGIKVQQAASMANLEPSVFCDKVSQTFQHLFHLANIGHTTFIRTTEEGHRKAVAHFWDCLVQRGYIYRGSYEGWYCSSDEAFLTETQITTTTDQDGITTKVSVDSGQPVEWTSEDNYMFRLSQFQSQLVEWLDKGVIFPSKFEAVVRSWLEEGLPDLSVSRQRQRLQWGIPVPGDQTQTIYVWLDALINYLTVGGYPESNFHWPVDCHVIGKDILKFHAVYWPAFLLAAGLEPPRRIVCHSHWMVNNEKMSKSRGNVIDPVDRIHKFSTDGMRYFLLKESVPHSDGNYTDEKVIECINSDLVNTLGNLLHRCTSASLNPDQVLPPLHGDSLQQHFSPEDVDRYSELHSLKERVDGLYSQFNVDKALDIVMSELRWANGMIQHHKPWELAKNSSQKQYLETLLHVAMETLIVCGLVLQPVIPNMADKLLTRLGVPLENRTWEKDQVWLRKMRKGSEATKLGHMEGVLIQRLDPKILQKMKL